MKRKLIISAIFLSVFAALYWCCLPDPLFGRSSSFILLDRNGNLCGARIAEDGQWRFPYDSAVPDKFRQCIVTFEDKRFYDHPGVDYKAVIRAIKQNFSSMKKVSGASTISMQVIRLARNRDRNLFQKVIESVMATRLEFRYSKDEILAMYASNAPFGGNVVGLQAASWRYYGKPARLLSWGEAATLAVLPNSPSLVRPGKNSRILRAKRDRLLARLCETGSIDKTTMELAMLEPLPGKPLPLPDLTPHLLDRLAAAVRTRSNTERQFASTIDADLQIKVNEIMQRHNAVQAANGVENMAVLIMNVETGEVPVYAANVKNENRRGRDEAIDNIMARRSTGSVLKPLLYASMLDDGQLLPEMLIPDVPMEINTWTPKNFNSTYDGAVPADKALARSLNIPAVYMLKQYSVPRFLHRLRKMGFTTFDRSAGNYGLSLILGGGETNLWELASVYTSLAQTLNNSEKGPGKMHCNLKPHFLKKESIGKTDPVDLPGLSAASVWQTFEAMVKVSRPDEEKYWANFASSGKIAWKTGTSFGNRDAWAVGCTPQYVVAVWVGNSNGTGRPGLTGISAAAPVLFDIFNMLPSDGEWFARPSAEMTEVDVCTESGMLASEHCTERKQILVKNLEYKNLRCTFHHLVHLDSKEQFRVNADCCPMSEMVHRSWFVLPPSIEKYYRLRHPEYKELPRLKAECQAAVSSDDVSEIVVVAPGNMAQIYLPVNLEGKRSSVVFEAVHQNLSATLYWHVDSRYSGNTKGEHQLAISAEPGKHELVIVDDAGNRLQRSFEIAGR